jgi:hypothetical protein
VCLRLFVLNYIFLDYPSLLPVRESFSRETVRLWVFSLAQQALFGDEDAVLVGRARKGLMGVRIAITDQNRREKIAQS